VAARRSAWRRSALGSGIARIGVGGLISALNKYRHLGRQRRRRARISVSLGVMARK